MFVCFCPEAIIISENKLRNLEEASVMRVVSEPMPIYLLFQDKLALGKVWVASDQLAGDRHLDPPGYWLLERAYMG